MFAEIWWKWLTMDFTINQGQFYENETEKVKIMEEVQM